MPNISKQRESADADVVLDANGLEKTYSSLLPWEPDVAVLMGASLELRAGEVVGIVGENGSGKSTLMQCLVGALEPDSGTVSRPGGVGWCPQDDRLYDRLTVDETFRLFGEAHDMTDAEIADAADRLTDRLDFERFRDRRVDRLSGGNRRKLTLSVSLMHDPDVLLLDEPYTGFDWETYLAFWDLADDLSEQGTAVAVISHLVSEQDRFDRIYELKDGELAEADDAGA
ncbi:ABC transporter ATP-binding protein [Halobacterium litoreum]|uniref:ABC transporter ATP-binding protein n=1 Tax=Halobacterium litoreum TaxID=2039234 RepID=A0ABD5NE23_9EURY|nr:ABC transporter ATP-binding protein [Halobacterium litoreum]UHH13784.1 ABC transporter ATP-binding protein [Halobacterium litoreum]